MIGKVVAITGANSGIGEVTALELAAKGAEVIMLCRRMEASEKVRAAIIEETGNSAVHLLPLDLSNQDQIRDTAGQIGQRFDKLDVLINNAGFMGYREHTLTPEGWEATMGTNHLGHFALTLRLMKLLQQSMHARILTVSSVTHKYAHIDWEDMEVREKYHPMKAYGKSKLMNLLFAKTLARRLNPQQITSNAIDPGAVYTAISKTYSRTFQTMHRIAKPFLLTPEQGARTSVYLASSDQVRGVTGELFKKCKVVKVAPQAENEEDMERLWHYSLRQTQLEEYDIPPIEV